ncbi:JmjC domain, hydroxylase-domain-containing protein [Lasiosphaeria miniovina]|uniref:JmjC domain, hydroxylase-domain-containing protein n=1 Tax=Lasiosphaeria miniovina TaxID=1954250 RepID=A0AA40DUS7_9PEZI|nr:JmjC domain, hydroxylase-domain-containing protein [Lasiosphaeria miniovina]KAK0714202.1 JmjC domain, hydroxylase-domain-containing protein [Lasiosphaeria miniovina]
MDGTRPSGHGLTSFDDVITKVENLLGRLKQARAALKPGGRVQRSGHETSAAARTLTDVDDQYSDPMSNALKSIISEATRLLEVHNSATFRSSPENHGDRPATSDDDVPTLNQQPVEDPQVPVEERSQAVTVLLRSKDANKGNRLTDKPSTDSPANLHHSSARVEHDFEENVLVLRPSVYQWQDFPAVLASARALDAEKIGAFKVVVSPELQLSLPPRDETTSRPRPCRGYRVQAFPNKTYQIEMPETRQVFRRTFPCSLPTLEAVQEHEALLNSENGLDGVYYRTDVPAETSPQRTAAGLTEESIIWPLKGNMLSRTKCSIPGLHWPYAYESGPKFGASFSEHEEHYGLYSISHLHVGRKLWKVIPPSAAVAFIQKLKESNTEIIWSCEQCVRHTAVFVPPSTLTDWGIPYTIIDQRASEVVVTMPRAYHSGFSTGYTLAEAVNYADADWTPNGHVACLPSCPDNPIPIEFLELLGPEEAQRRVEDLGREEEAREQQARKETKKQEAKKRSRKRQPVDAARPSGNGDETEESDADEERDADKESDANEGSNTSQSGGFEPAIPNVDIQDTGAASMPIFSEEPAEQITQMIDYILAQRFPPKWLGCTEHDESFRTRLKRFLPGGWLDGVLMSEVLQILYRGSGISVQDPTNMETAFTRLDQDLLQAFDALVLLVYADSCEQLQNPET